MAVYNALVLNFCLSQKLRHHEDIPPTMFKIDIGIYFISHTPGTVVLEKVNAIIIDTYIH